MNRLIWSELWYCTGGKFGWVGGELGSCVKVEVDVLGSRP